MDLGPENLPDGQTGLVMCLQSYKNVAMAGAAHWHFRK